VEALIEKRFEQEPLGFLVSESLNFALGEFVQEDQKDAFQRKCDDLIAKRVSFLLEKVQEDRALSLEDALTLIDDERGNLPLLQENKGLGSLQRSFHSEENLESSEPSKPKAKQKKPLADEPVEVTRARPRRKETHHGPK
jgi:hypothetical protein